LLYQVEFFSIYNVVTTIMLIDFKLAQYVSKIACILNKQKGSEAANENKSL